MIGEVPIGDVVAAIILIGCCIGIISAIAGESSKRGDEKVNHTAGVGGPTRVSGEIRRTHESRPEPLRLPPHKTEGEPREIPAPQPVRPDNPTARAARVAGVARRITRADGPPLRLSPHASGKPPAISAPQAVRPDNAAARASRPAGAVPRVTKVADSPLALSKAVFPHWQEKNWRKRGNLYTGQFTAGRHHWRGEIREPYPGGYTATIWDPPIWQMEERHHPHRPCFQSRGDKKYSIHLHSAPKSVDHLITNVETILREVTSR